MKQLFLDQRGDGDDGVPGCIRVRVAYELVGVPCEKSNGWEAGGKPDEAAPNFGQVSARRGSDGDDT